jgi:hypothetical protein
MSYTRMILHTPEIIKLSYYFEKRGAAFEKDGISASPACPGCAKGL